MHTQQYMKIIGFKFQVSRNLAIGNLGTQSSSHAAVVQSTQEQYTNRQTDTQID